MESGVKIRGFILIGVFIASLVWTTSASAQSDFYKGKTITVYIGTTPGALYDQWSRLLAQYMPKHIPGKPDMISQNMPGAGHKIAANYVYNKTKPDGLSLIARSCHRSISTSSSVDLRCNTTGEICLGWFTGAGRIAMYMRADTPYKTIEDVRNAKEPPRCGAQDVGLGLLPAETFEDTLGRNSTWFPAIRAVRRSILPSREEKFIVVPLQSRLFCRASLIIPGARKPLSAISFRPGTSEIQS